MKFTIPRLVGVVCGLMLCVVLLQAVLPSQNPPLQPPAEPAADCIGEPIVVDYAFSGWTKPHACAIQCVDDQPRYILYTDGNAAQCETPPGCNDTGEDKGVLCVPSMKSV